MTTSTSLLDGRRGTRRLRHGRHCCFARIRAARRRDRAGVDQPLHRGTSKSHAGRRAQCRLGRQGGPPAARARPPGSRDGESGRWRRSCPSGSRRTSAGSRREQAGVIGFAALSLCRRSRRVPREPRHARCSSVGGVSSPPVETPAYQWSSGTLGHLPAALRFVKPGPWRVCDASVSIRVLVRALSPTTARLGPYRRLPAAPFWKTSCRRRSSFSCPHPPTPC
jgi:hypothetical protein